MKKILLSFVIFALGFLAFTFSPVLTHAQAPNASPGVWVIDPEVTFIGKNAARSGLMLDWTLQNYSWVCVTAVNTRTVGGATGRSCDNANNPLADFWRIIVTFIVVPMLFVVILASSIVIIITRGRSLTIMRFIPRFIAVILLIVFSYALLQFIYQFVDVIQGFFLRSDLTKICPPNCISQRDLLYVGWEYQKFVGYRLLGDQNSESAFMSLLLTKLTALTYYVMVGILLVRKVILWFFIIVSPIFPLLLMYYPVRNTGKIWIGEFFRWLLYAPLFAIFLNGLVYTWRNKIPLVFDNPNIGDASKVIFPTAVNILLGGPKELVRFDPVKNISNSVNLTETFALYVVALIMLWIVILLPWILLQIFLDYASNFSAGESPVVKNLMNRMGKSPAPKSPVGYPPTSPESGGSALNLPFAKKFNIPESLKQQPIGSAKQMIPEGASRFARPISLPTAQINAQALSLANISVPSMRDIARYDTAQISKDTTRQQEVSQVRQALEKIATPASSTSSVEREKYTEIHEKLSNESQQGNVIASSLLNAVSTVSQQNIKASTSQLKNVLTKIANPATATNSADKERFTKLHQALEKESKENNSQLASSILKVNDSTSDKEVDKIKSQLTQTKGNTTIANINSTVQNHQNAETLRNVFQQMANPSAVKTADREKTTALHNELVKQSQKGNDLATAILSVKNTTSMKDISSLQDRIARAKEQRDPLATQLADMTKTSVTSLPAVNRVQTVKQEDYEAVKKLWKESYQGLEGNKSQVVKDDIASIDRIVGLLSSTDSEQVSQGMQEVSAILPFLLVGGFSQTEVIAYLKAKQEAAKETLQTVTQEEEEKVAVPVKKAAEAQQTMAASVSADEDDDEEPSALAGASAATPSAPVVSAPPQNSEILAMSSLKLPTIRDIAKYETSVLKKEKATIDEVEATRSILEKIGNPMPLPAGEEKAKFEQLREKLLEESQSKNPTADMILTAAAHLTEKVDKMSATLAEMKTVLQQIAAPQSVSTTDDREFYTRLHDYLEKESKEKNNDLATQILGVNASTTAQQLQAIKEQLIAQSQSTDDLASQVISGVNSYVQARQFRRALQEILKPSAISTKNKAAMQALADEMKKASDSGNSLASAMLGVQETASDAEIAKMYASLQEANSKGDQFAAQVLKQVGSSTFPTPQYGTGATDDDYEAVKQLWEDTYRTLPVPGGFSNDTNGRISWIKDDSKQTEDIINLLLDPSKEKKDEGLQKVASIVPFLLLGGFSFPEVVQYLQVKQEAANAVLAELTAEEEKSVTVDVAKSTEEQKTMSTEVKSTDESSK